MPIKVKRDLDAVLAKNKTNRKIITQTNKVIKLARGLFKDADINLRKLKKQRTVYIQPPRELKTIRKSKILIKKDKKEAVPPKSDKLEIDIKPLASQKSETTVESPVKKRDLNIKITLPIKKDQPSLRSVKTLEHKKVNSFKRIPNMTVKRKLTRISEKPLHEKNSCRLSSLSSEEDNSRSVVVKDLSEVESM